ncbi:acetyltransferase [Paenibacillus sp. FJAT-26967]|uniref:acetyltransferase n=1 Tax=Paenibacillus sp. FJAT-26967 TaxID=1729690 RepID=UPI000838BF96|nr:acetyltransferase [Paenibacillus sp. FJAT-26967]
MRRLILIGDGGHAKVVRDVALSEHRYELTAVLDDRYEEAGRGEDGLLRGPVKLARHMLREDDGMDVFVAIGSNTIRRKVAEALQAAPERFALLIHPRAVVSTEARLAPGTVVMPGAVINAGASIGAHGIVNTCAIVEHDCVVGGYAHLSPGSALAGGVTVHEGAHVGIGAAVIQGLTIGAWSLLGAGAVAVRDIPDRCTAVGVPAAVIKGRND